MVRLLASLLLVPASGLVAEGESLLQVANLGVSNGESEWLFATKGDAQAKDEHVLVQDEGKPKLSPMQERATAAVEAANDVKAKVGATASTYYQWALSSEKARLNDLKCAEAQKEADEAKAAAMEAAARLEAGTKEERVKAYQESDNKNKAQTQAFSRWQTCQNTGRIHAESSMNSRHEADTKLREETAAIAHEAQLVEMAKKKIQAMANNLKLQQDADAHADDELGELQQSDVEEEESETVVDDDEDVADGEESLAKVREDAQKFVKLQLTVGKKFESKSKALNDWAEAVEVARESKHDVLLLEDKIEDESVALVQTDEHNELIETLESARDKFKQDARVVASAERKLGQAEAAAAAAMAAAAEHELVVRARALGQ